MNDGVGRVPPEGIVFLRQPNRWESGPHGRYARENLSSRRIPENQNEAARTATDARALLVWSWRAPTNLVARGAHAAARNQVAAEIAGRAGYEDRHKGSEGAQKRDLRSHEPLAGPI